jgi:ubiquinone/menaquinone biosynthesis C-methylase UbiE
MTFWRWKAPVYSLVRRLPFFRHILAAEQNHLVKLLQQLPPVSGVQLDLGSGSGDNWDILPRARQRIAVDAEWSMLVRHPEPSRLVARAEALPFLPESFALVSAIGLLEYIKDFEIFFREIRRVLQPAGYFLFTSSPPNWANRWRLVWGEKLYFHTAQQLQNFLASNGWRLIGHTRSWLQEQWLVAPVEAYRETSPA